MMLAELRGAALTLREFLGVVMVMRGLAPALGAGPRSDLKASLRSWLADVSTSSITSELRASRFFSRNPGTHRG